MMKPIDAIVVAIVDQLDAGQLEEFEERAAILEFDAGYSRAHAECVALLNVLRRYPDVLKR